MTDHKVVFNTIYENNAWGYGSGSGSLPQTTEPYRWFLSNFLKANKIRKVLDIGCGDWQFSRLMDWSGIEYVGVDVSSVVLANTMQFARAGVSFIEANAVTDELPDADLILMKDVIQHWSNSDISAFIPKMKKYRRALITNGFHPGLMHVVNKDIAPGDYRPVNLLLEPFSVDGNFVFWYDGGEPKATFLVNAGT